jgi:hypothetical protein
MGLEVTSNSDGIVGLEPIWTAEPLLAPENGFDFLNFVWREVITIEEGSRSHLTRGI